MAKWFIYIVRCSDKSLYTGITTDVAARVKAHNTGQGAKYTRSRLPVKLVYQKAMPSESAARQREAAIKKLPRKEKLALIFKFSAVIPTRAEARRRNPKLRDSKQLRDPSHGSG